MKALDIELGEEIYEIEQFDRAQLAAERDLTPQRTITPDADMAFKLCRAFNTLGGWAKRDTIAVWRQRATFAKVLAIMGVNFRVDYGAPVAPRLFINAADGGFIDYRAQARRRAA